MVDFATNRKRAIPDELWSLLCGHKWHATSMAGLIGIVDSGAIEVRPGYNSFCKTKLGAISLFDFGLTARDIESRGHWSEWCGFQQASKARACGFPEKEVGIWLQINDAYRSENLIDARTVRAKWKEHRVGNILPGIEGAHRGPLNVDHIDQVVVISRNSMAEPKTWAGTPTLETVGQISAYIDTLPAQPFSKVEQAMLNARQRPEPHANPSFPDRN